MPGLGVPAQGSRSWPRTTNNLGEPDVSPTKYDKQNRALSEASAATTLLKESSGPNREIISRPSVSSPYTKKMPQSLLANEDPTFLNTTASYSDIRNKTTPGQDFPQASAPVSINSVEMPPCVKEEGTSHDGPSTMNLSHWPVIDSFRPWGVLVWAVCVSAAIVEVCLNLGLPWDEWSLGRVVTLFAAFYTEYLSGLHVARLMLIFEVLFAFVGFVWYMWLLHNYICRVLMRHSIWKRKRT
jgi:hypothetical protein